MQTVTSTDGTRIAYEQHGDGPPLVLLHGSSTTHRSWDAVCPLLADEFTLVVPDRRGRGESGDAEEYSLAREIEDIRALVDALDGDVSLFGHSFGGLIALAASRELSPELLVLYEPAVLTGEYRDDDLSARMRARLHADGREAAMKLFFQDGAGIPAPEQLPIWPRKVDFDLVETVIRENEAVEAYELPGNLPIECPTLLLEGERGPEHLHAAVDVLADRLSEKKRMTFDGVGHIGTQSAPEWVAETVHSFSRRVVSQSATTADR
jgi:pimeloyl-ACP methyl ester carboxylesterase